MAQNTEYARLRHLQYFRAELCGARQLRAQAVFNLVSIPIVPSSRRVIPGNGQYCYIFLVKNIVLPVSYAFQ
jgi:hypothetical protein